MNFFGMQMRMHFVRLTSVAVQAVGRAAAGLRFCGGVLDFEMFEMEVEVEPIRKSRYFVN